MSLYFYLMKNLLFLSVAILAISCTAQKNFDTQAHRGGKTLYPENTIAAMKNALEMGVQTLEMDLQISKDKQVIVSHDAYFHGEFSTKPDGTPVNKEEAFDLKYYTMDYDSIKKYDVGLKFYSNNPEQKKLSAQVPLLGNLLDSCESYAQKLKRPAPFYNIETKTRPFSDNILHPEPEEFVRLMMNVINRRNIGDRVIIQSFDPRTLEIMHRDYPHIKTALLVEKVDDKKIAQQRARFQQIPVEKFKLYPNHLNGVKGDLQFLSFIPTIYSPAHELVTPELVKECHKLGMKVIPWTVNSRQRLQELKSMGIDGAITDDPRIFE